MLPEPALSFTIPSLHDGTVLDCRVYHPASQSSWRRQAAVVAHPYAPMGGSYDDPVLDSVATALLRTGYLVTTFNFRGAGHSAGRTSWTARPERDDYASVVGFTAHYVHFLDGRARPESPADDGASPASETQDAVLLMGGYSYGAMITAQIPPLGRVLEAFARPRADSYAAQIRLRAQHLAEQQNTMLGGASARRMRNPRLAAVRVGGDEGDGPARKSHEGLGRRSFSLDAEDRLRRGVHELVAKTRRAKQPPAPDEHDEHDEHGQKLPAVTGLHPRPAYLLVSPLQGLVAHLATMSLLPSRMRQGRRHDDDDDDDAAAAENKLTENATLAVFGDRDVFVPVGRLRGWLAGLRGRRGSLLVAREVAAAGHFWAEDGVLAAMTESVAAFAGGLARHGDSRRQLQSPITDAQPSTKHALVPAPQGRSPLQAAPGRAPGGNTNGIAAAACGVVFGVEDAAWRGPGGEA